MGVTTFGFSNIRLNYAFLLKIQRLTKVVTGLKGGDIRVTTLERKVVTQKHRQIGERIASIRGSLSRPKFSADAGIHKNTLERYENGDRSPDVDFFLFLSSRGVNLNWLLNGIGPMMLADLRAVREDDATYAAPALDVELLRAVIEGVEEALQATNRKMKPANKADLVLAVYDLYDGVEQKPDTAKILKLVQSVS